MLAALRAGARTCVEMFETSSAKFQKVVVENPSSLYQFLPPRYFLAQRGRGGVFFTFKSSEASKVARAYNTLAFQIVAPWQIPRFDCSNRVFYYPKKVMILRAFVPADPPKNSSPSLVNRVWNVTKACAASAVSRSSPVLSGSFINRAQQKGREMQRRNETKVLQKNFFSQRSHCHGGRPGPGVRWR